MRFDSHHPESFCYVRLSEPSEDGSDTTYGKPRMQMYLFTQPPYRNADGDFDGDVIIHEYTHGLSTRLVGGPSNVDTFLIVPDGVYSYTLRVADQET